MSIIKNNKLLDLHDIIHLIKRLELHCHIHNIGNFYGSFMKHVGFWVVIQI